MPFEQPEVVLHDRATGAAKFELSETPFIIHQREMSENQESDAELVDTGSLRRVLSDLEDRLSNLRAERNTTPFANDIFEAADDWKSAAKAVLERNTKWNYQARASSE